MYKNPTVSELNEAQAAGQDVYFRENDTEPWTKDNRVSLYTEQMRSSFDLKIEGTPAPVVYVNEYFAGEQWGYKRFDTAQKAYDDRTNHRHLAVRRLVLDPDFKFVPEPVSRITMAPGGNCVEFKPNGNIPRSVAQMIFTILRDSNPCVFNCGGHQVQRNGEIIHVGCVKDLTWTEVLAFAKEQGWI